VYTNPKTGEVQRRYVIKEWVLDPHGVRRPKYFTGRLKRDAEERLNEWHKAHPTGVTGDKTLTVKTVLDRYLNAKADDLAPSTMVTYRAAYKDIVEAFGSTKAEDLKPEQIDQLFSRCRHKGLSPRSIKLRRDVLFAAFNLAVRRRALSWNVVTATDAPKLRPSPKRERRALSAKELATFLETARTLPTKGKSGSALYEYFLVLFGLGLRRGEVLGLRWSDWNRKTAQISVEQQVVREQGKGIHVKSTLKTDGSKAKLRVSNEVARALNARRTVQEADKRAAGSDWHETGLIFTTTTGTLYDPKNVNREMQRIAGAAGLGHLATHDARRTVATLLDGLPPTEAQRLLRHTTAWMTLDTYTLAHDNQGKAAADAMGKFLSAPPPPELRELFVKATASYPRPRSQSDVRKMLQPTLLST
jgi:integrase